MDADQIPLPGDRVAAESELAAEPTPLADAVGAAEKASLRQLPKADITRRELTAEKRTVVEALPVIKAFARHWVQRQAEFRAALANGGATFTDGRWEVLTSGARRLYGSSTVTPFDVVSKYADLRPLINVAKAAAGVVGADNTLPASVQSAIEACVTNEESISSW